MAKTFENLPVSMLYKFIRTKKIKLNGKRCEASCKICEGDVVDLYIKDEFLVDSGEPQSFKNIVPKLSILYEDKNILLCDKKPGVIVHPDENEEVNTLINHVTAYLYKKGEYDPDSEHSFAPALCNRIDRNTGGIVICAKNAETLRILNEKIKNKEIEKSYLCLVHGILGAKEGIAAAWHKKNAEDNTVTINKNRFAGSKIIETKYEVLEEKDGVSLVRAELITGRTHQIRAHFAYLGHPLVGDGKYGRGEDGKADRKKGFFGQALYSYRIKFSFEGDAGVLGYLCGRTFQVDVASVLSNWLW